MESIMQLISTVGFPIAAYLLMFWLVERRLKDNTLATRELRDLIRKLMERLQ